MELLIICFIAWLWFYNTSFFPMPIEKTVHFLDNGICLVFENMERVTSSTGYDADVKVHRYYVVNGKKRLGKLLHQYSFLAGGWKENKDEKTLIELQLEKWKHFKIKDYSYE